MIKLGKMKLSSGNSFNENIAQYEKRFELNREHIFNKQLEILLYG